MDLVVALWMFAATMPQAQSAAPEATPPQVTVTADGGLIVYYPILKQMLVYTKLSEDIDKAATAAALRKAEADYELALVSGNATRSMEALSRLTEARRKALDRNPADPSYSCIGRYEIPATPATAIKWSPCSAQ